MNETIKTTAKFIGYRDVNRAAAFLVPVQAVRPLNPYPISFPAWSSIGADFEIGVSYNVQIRKSPYGGKEWEVVSLAD